MLRHLHISNYAIIDRVELAFSDRLTTITGETGAGKSILVGALSLLLGSRADLATLYDKTRKCVVEGVFDVGAYGLQDFFEEHGLDYSDECTIRREINPQGKSRAFVNDTPVTLEVLRELTSNLVDLHRQHETLELASDRFQLKVVDAMAGHGILLKEYMTQHKALRALENELSQLAADNAKAQEQFDYQQFQLKELREANLVSGEQEELENELKVLTHAEEIAEALRSAGLMMSEGEGSLGAVLKAMEAGLKKVAAFDSRISRLLERVEASRIELDDVGHEIARLADHVEHDPARQQMVTERLDLIFRLQQKHKAVSVDDLMKRRDELEESIRSLAGMDDRITALRGEAAARRTALISMGNKLTAGRREAASTLRKQITALLPAVGLPHAVLRIEQEVQPELGAQGFDRISFLFSANPGKEPEEIRRVASGGELSRLMLVIRSLMASSASMPTLIFDEVDEGVSGEVARKIGSMLRDLAASHQVICITHLPQIAANGHAHYYVYKEVQSGRTITFVKSLDVKERVVEIAKMLSGDQPTAAALENAKELLTLN